MSAPPAPAPDALLARWRAEWPAALAAWSAHTLLREPRFLEKDDRAQAPEMVGQIACIRLRDHSVSVNLETIRRLGLEDDAKAILAHEIGHHVHVPGSATEDARLFAVLHATLPGLPASIVHKAANLYADLMVNDRLQRRAGVDVAAVYRKLVAAPGPADAAWTVYTRAYEHLWRLAPGTLSPPGVTQEMDEDAALVARIVRSFGADWLRGARRFGHTMYRWMAEDHRKARAETLRLKGLADTEGAGRPLPGEAGADAIPDGLVEVDPAELDEGDFEDELEDPVAGKAKHGRKKGQGPPGGLGQCREPFQYGQILDALGLKLGRDDITARYYRERALPHLLPFPARRQPRATEPLAEGWEDWQPGDALEALDPLGSVLRSPHVVPGVTTVQRVYGEMPGADPKRTPMDLDLYVDCSGSMPDPAGDTSYLALAGTVLALSALRAGARVQATLWSGTGQVKTSGGFVRDEKALLPIITGYISGGTAFPLHVLRDTYAERKKTDPPAHVVVISDDGADTMLQKDERANDGADVCAAALAKARGGGTLVLNLRDVDRWPALPVMRKLGFRVHAVTRWEDLPAFAARFVRENYGEGA